MFPLYAIKLGHFTVNTIMFMCYKHSSLVAKIGERVKTTIGGIASWICRQQEAIIKPKKTGTHLNVDTSPVLHSLQIAIQNP